MIAPLRYKLLRARAVLRLFRGWFATEDGGSLWSAVLPGCLPRQPAADLRSG